MALGWSSCEKEPEMSQRKRLRWECQRDRQRKRRAGVTDDKHSPSHWTPSGCIAWLHPAVAGLGDNLVIRRSLPPGQAWVLLLRLHDQRPHSLAHASKLSVEDEVTQKVHICHKTQCAGKPLPGIQQGEEEGHNIRK